MPQRRNVGFFNAGQLLQGRDPITGQSRVNPLALQLALPAPRTGTETALRLLTMALQTDSNRSDQRLASKELAAALAPVSETQPTTGGVQTQLQALAGAGLDEFQSPEAANLPFTGTQTTERPKTGEQIAAALLGSTTPSLQRLGGDLTLQRALQPAPETFAPVELPGGIQGQQSSASGKILPLPKPPVSKLLSPEAEAQQIRLRNAGRSQQTINVGGSGIDYGDPPKGTAWARNQDGSVALSRDEKTGFMRPIAVEIAGGPTETKRIAGETAKTKAQEQRQVYADIVTQDIDRVVDIAGAQDIPVTGFGAIGAAIPGTRAFDVSQLLDTIRSNVGFDRLQQMRAASPTGGALGQVSERENILLQSTIGSLAQTQSKAQFLRNLKRVKEIYLDTIHGKGNRPKKPDPVIVGTGPDIGAMSAEQIVELLQGNPDLPTDRLRAAQDRLEELGF